MFLAVLTLAPAGAAKGGNVGWTSTGMFAQFFLQVPNQVISISKQEDDLQTKMFTNIEHGCCFIIILFSSHGN